ncbi:MAG TPA: hypothetical protein VMV17_17830 [Streptosporangiaceae bacterium]|nr:hypothetical protein [Streptosporangiaceae bacterium]
MSDIIAPAPAGNGPWRLLVLDRDPDDPRWIIATVALPEDVRPAVLDVGGSSGWEGAGRWPAERVGRSVGLAGLHDPLAWTIREGRTP